MRILILLAMGVCMFLGCTNSLIGTINTTNKSFEKEQLAYRYIEVEKEKSHTTFQLQLAGIPHQTVALSSELLFNDILKGVNQKCGFRKEDLVETRKVAYTPPKFYEVWVFKDPLSERPDKKSGISILLTQLPKNGGVNINIVGACHSVPRQMTFGN